jgi:cytochrome c556
MGSKTLMTLLFVVVVSGSTAAQRRPYNLIMKEMGATAETLRKDLESDPAAVVVTAGRLEGLFKETEEFWTQFKTKDAVDAAKGGRDVVLAVSAAARSKDLQKARNTASGLGKFCAACHNSHREQLPDKTYRIRP